MRSETCMQAILAPTCPSLLFPACLPVILLWPDALPAIYIPPMPQLPPVPCSVFSSLQLSVKNHLELFLEVPLASFLIHFRFSEEPLLLAKEALLQLIHLPQSLPAVLVRPVTLGQASHCCCFPIISNNVPLHIFSCHEAAFTIPNSLWHCAGCVDAIIDWINT
jgi:hypothetical protein